MSQPFPQHPYLSGNFAPILMECDAPDLPVIGEIPKTLAGTLYRNGPNPQFAPRDGNYHWFGGDGMIHAFRIADGKVAYRNRWVRTPKWQLEHAAGKALFGSMGNPMTSDPAVVGKDSGLANTNIVWHGGRLLALEEAHQPFELDPESLAPRGYQSLDGKIERRFTAHPKIDPETGEMVFFAYAAAGPFTPDMLYGVVDKQGKVTRLEAFKAPFASMVHDFLVTRNHALFPILPLTGSLERAMKGLPPYAWEPEKGSHVGVMRRDSKTADMRWFTTDACYVFHPMNMWEEGDRIIADVMQYEAAPLFPKPDGTPGDQSKARARLCRWTFDLAGNSNTIKREYLDDIPGEFPRFDERFAGLPYRHGYYAARREDKPDVRYDSLAHFDAKTGQRRLYALPAGDVAGEPIFVPRRADAAEGDGWLLATVYRGTEHRSDLLVFEAEALAEGPVATVQLSHRVPFGFHGNWRPAA
ncbi:MAG TPA: carotenoid oxygenase family protein [Candidatus Sulfotelmatobacter sp.]|nr:carotenoid oxygenase family protein [Candidatus Sulfotelmatobacter sp.]